MCKAEMHSYGYLWSVFFTFTLAEAIANNQLLRALRLAAGGGRCRRSASCPLFLFLPASSS